MGSTKELIIKDICNLYKIGLTNSEIADELEISLETVKSYMKRYIRTCKDYKHIKQLHDLRKKKMQEVKRMNKRIARSAKMEIDRRVRKFISNEALVKKSCNSAYEYKNGSYRYKYDKDSKPADLPSIHREYSTLTN